MNKGQEVNKDLTWERLALEQLLASAKACVQLTKTSLLLTISCDSKHKHALGLSTISQANIPNVIPNIKFDKLCLASRLWHENDSNVVLVCHTKQNLL